ncbi:restriction endonuclease subunit S [Aurantimonas litoralis]|nr:restriction endonuclease subunit S [Aurantimonas litoralis]
MIDPHLLEAIGDAPDHITALRKLAVAFAIGGRLDTDDRSSTEELLEEIDYTKAHLRKSSALKKKNAALVVLPEHLPEAFADPSRFVPLGRVASIEKGKTGIKQALPGNYPLVVTAAARETCDHFDFDAAAAIVPLVSSTGHGNASINRLHYQEGQFALGTILAAIFPHDPEAISARFLFEYLSAFKEELLVSRMTGTANVTLTTAGISAVPVPLLSRQAQAKVDELMALCDRLEEARKTREKTRDKLTAASLARLTAPETTPEDFPAHAAFALEALPALTTRPDHIKTLRQTILNLAVRGKLVEQDPADEPAFELLAEITGTRKHLMRSGKILKKKEAERDPERGTAPLPSSWKWIALGQLCNLVTSGSRGWGDYYSDEGAAFLRAQNVRFGRLELDHLARVSPPVNSEGSRTQISLGDLVVVITGAGVTTPALLERDLGEAYVSQHVALVRLTDPRLSPWILLCLMADEGGRSELVDRAYGAGRPGLNLENIRSLSVPIPPLAEQNRILVKVDALMALSDRLEAALATANVTRTRLLEALLHDALEPEAELLEAAE